MIKSNQTPAFHTSKYFWEKMNLLPSHFQKEKPSSFLYFSHGKALLFLSQLLSLVISAQGFHMLEAPAEQVAGTNVPQASIKPPAFFILFNSYRLALGCLLLCIAFALIDFGRFFSDGAAKSVITHGHKPTLRACKQLPADQDSFNPNYLTLSCIINCFV